MHLIRLWFCFLFHLCCLVHIIELLFIYFYCFEAHGRHARERHSRRSTLRSNEGYGHETGWAQWHGTPTQPYGPTLSRYESIFRTVSFDLWFHPSIHPFYLTESVSIYLCLSLILLFFLSICHSIHLLTIIVSMIYDVISFTCTCVKYKGCRCLVHSVLNGRQMVRSLLNCLDWV